jgi:membrane-bound lytic murein transglycosylase D
MKLLITWAIAVCLFWSFLASGSESPFVVDGRLRKNVDFWVSIYTQYDTHQGLIHDSKYIDRIYEVTPAGNAAIAKRKWRAVLLSLHRKRKNPERWSEEEKKVALLFEGAPDAKDPIRFLKAAHFKRLRFQLGQKDRFLEGLQQSGRYLPLMEEIFKKEGLPIELTRLPFVESSFNLKAHSKSGASGIWQFMRTTGRRFLRVSATVDERNDPLRATEAAAKLLKRDYELLGTWPLTVTAYNHGSTGILRAVRKVGSSDLEEVVQDYRSRSFGFASGNFFAEFLAAVEVERNAEKYFGKIERAKLLEGLEVALPAGIEFRELCGFLKLNPQALRELNPALSHKILRGRSYLPAGLLLRLPLDPSLGREAQARVFLAGFEQIPAIYKQKAQKRVKYAKDL